MQIFGGTCNGHLFCHHTAKRGRDRRGFRVPHACIADQRQIRMQCVFVGVQERNKRRRTGLFFALKKHRDPRRELAVDGHEGTRRFDKGHQLAFVVR